MRKSRLELLREAKQQKLGPRQMDIDGLLKLLVDPKRVLDENRELMPTQREFIYDNRFVVGYMGAAGAAKTSSLCAAGLIRALMVPDTRLLVARNDYNDLMDTTAKRLEEMVNALPQGTLIDRNKNPPMKWWINPIGGGEPSQITFMGLKEELSSYEFTDAIIDECNEITLKAFEQVIGRTRYIREGVPREAQLQTVRFAFNPQDKTHWLYTAVTGRDHQERLIKEPIVDHLYTPRPRENEQNLRPGYYDDLLRKMSKDTADRLVRGMWGAEFPGDPVFKQFDPEMHASRRLAPETGKPMLRFWDFGYNRPYVCWAQVDWAGRLLVYREFLGERIEAGDFAKRVKGMSSQFFPWCREYIDYGDPAVVQKKDTGSTLAVFARHGISMHFRKSTIEEGLRLIRERLDLRIEKQAAMQFDPEGCPILIRALQGGYHLDDKVPPKPKKDGFYDHPVDAFRYGVINVLGGGASVTSASYNPLLEQHSGSLEYDPNADHF